MIRRRCWHCSTGFHRSKGDVEDRAATLTPCWGTGATTRERSVAVCVLAASYPSLRCVTHDMVAGWDAGAGLWNVRLPG
jgi:hypothetical protein